MAVRTIRSATQGLACFLPAFLLGLDHTLLTYRYSGRDFHPTAAHGDVAKKILA